VVGFLGSDNGFLVVKIELETLAVSCWKGELNWLDELICLENRGKDPGSDCEKREL